MGIFSFWQDGQEAAMEAEEWDVEMICDRMRRALKADKKAQATGYGRTLQMKAKNMRDSELKELWDFIYDSKNAVARNVVAPIMQDRGLIQKDEAGNIIKQY